MSGGIKAQSSNTVEQLINELYETRYAGPERQTVSPTSWNFGFTPPMKRLLDMGPAAQDALLSVLPDPRVKDQVIMLLGGIGDERVIQPIINEMVPATERERVRDWQRINDCASLALTNITTGEAIWERAGGTVVDLCPDKPKECWQKWWDNNRQTFRIKNITKKDRNYGNYPNYGIYKRD